MTLLEQVTESLGIWEEARPHLHLMYDEQEMQLLAALQGREVTAAQAAVLLGIAAEDATRLLQQAYGRHVADRRQHRGTTVYSAAAFDSRVNHFATYDSLWDTIPAADRQAIDRRFLDRFIDKHRVNVERKLQGLEAENALPNDTVMLLSEIEEMIQAAEHVVVQPCDCRRLGQNCDRPVETCIWLDDAALEALDRGHGRRVSREEAKEYTGTSAGLWAITAAVYLSLMGPEGMRELGQTIMQKAQYAAKRISEVKGLDLKFSSPFFKEFVVCFDDTGKSVADINKALLEHKIFGGKDVSKEFPELGQSALYCVTEIMTKEDIDRLAGALAEVTR